VTIVFTDDAIDTLQLPEKYRGVNVTIYYAQGPVLDPKYPGTFTTLATYTSEIHSVHTNLTRGQQTGTPAIIMGTYGAGRVLLSSPHPEATSPMLLDIIKGYVLWATKRI
jgi:glutamine amidotransferase-like uncharacterized protein